MIVTFYVKLNLLYPFTVAICAYVKQSYSLDTQTNVLQAVLHLQQSCSCSKNHRFFPPVPHCLFTNIFPPSFPLLIPLTYPLSQSDKGKVLFLFKKKRNENGMELPCRYLLFLIEKQTFSKTRDAVAASGLTLD